MNMTGADVRAARERRGWQQEELAARLGVSQGYVSLFESGQRPVSNRLAARLVSLLSLSPSALPVSTRPKPLPNQQVARALGRLGYPGFAYLRSGSKVNPMEALLGALLADDVDARVVEGLPWLLVRYPDVDWDQLVAYAKQHDAQNRLGFLVALAGRLAAANGDVATTELLERREQALQRSLLQHDDAFSRTSLTQAERRWLVANRSPEAKRWNVLATLNVDRLLNAG
jgi:transcriptional regulator with XRE-family HTH domain